MRAKEGALVAFTLLMQASVGTVLVAIAAAGFSADCGPSLNAAAALGLLALVASLFHLGRPAQARLALANVKTSWLSREVILSAAFVASCGALVVARGRENLETAAVSLTAMLGLLAIYAMARLYMIAAQPAWNRWLTPATFFTSTLLLGIVVILNSTRVEAPFVTLLAVSAAGFLVTQIVLAGAYVKACRAEPHGAISTIATRGGWLAPARIAIATLAAVLLEVWAFTPGASPALAVAALACVVMSEIAGRVLFYAGRVSFGPA